jgi:Ca2+/H+ antiporter
MTDNKPVAAPAGTDYPGKTLGIVGLIVAIFANLIGLIISAIALNQSKKAGYKNTPALAGVIVGAILLVLGIIITIVSVVAAVSMGTTTTY